jgi:hypothetical protein
MNQIIISAIQNKQTLSFTYDQKPRVVGPHTYGLTTTSKESLRAYQTQGGHASSHRNDPWHLFTVSKMLNLQCTGNSFNGARHGYKRTDSIMQNIYAQL